MLSHSQKIKLLVAPQLSRQRGRLLLSVAAIGLGVASVVGVFVTNASTSKAFEDRTRPLLNEPDVSVFPITEDWIDDDAVRTLVGDPAVKISFRTLEATISEPRSTYLIGFDSKTARQSLNLLLEEGRLFRPGADDAVVTTTLARALGLNIGAQLGPRTATHSRREHSGLKVPAFRVTGIASSGPTLIPSTQPDHARIYVSLRTAQRWLNAPGQVNRIHLYLNSHIDTARWIETRAVQFPQLEFSQSAFAAEYRRLFTTLQQTLLTTSAIGVFAGLILVYLNFSSVVRERTQMYGLLHAIGATDAQIAYVVLAEAIWLGLVSSVAGLGLGYALAAGLVQLVENVAQVKTQTAAVTPTLLILSICIGVLVSMIGALTPAVRAARLNPIEVMRGLVSPPRRNFGWVAGAVLLSSGLAYTRGRAITSGIWYQTALLAVIAGAVLMLPLVVRLLAQLIRRRQNLVQHGLNRVTVKRLIHEPDRAALSLGAVMVALSAIVTLGAVNSSLRNALDVWVDRRFGADLLLYGPPVTPDVEQEIRATPGVAGLTRIDFGTAVIMTRPVRATQNLILLDPDSFFDIVGFPWHSGSETEARTALSRGGSVLITARLANRNGIRQGDSVYLRGFGATKAFQVAGIYSVFGEGPEVGIIGSTKDRRFFDLRSQSSALYINHTRDASVSHLIAELEPLFVRERIQGNAVERPVHFGLERTLGPYQIDTTSGIKQRARSELTSYIVVFLAVVFVAVTVGALVVGHALAASVFLRVREIAMLQAIGAEGRSVRRMILSEAFAVVMTALVLALILGMVVSHVLVSGLGAALGFPISLAFPWALAPFVGLLALLVAVAAGTVPARIAASFTPVDGLRMD